MRIETSVGQQPLLAHHNKLAFASNKTRRERVLLCDTVEISAKAKELYHAHRRSVDECVTRSMGNENNDLLLEKSFNRRQISNDERNLKIQEWRDFFKNAFEEKEDDIISEIVDAILF